MVGGRDGMAKPTRAFMACDVDRIQANFSKRKTHASMDIPAILVAQGYMEVP